MVNDMNPMLSSTPNMSSSSRHWSSTPIDKVSHSSPVRVHRPPRRSEDVKNRKLHHNSDEEFEASHFEEDEGMIQSSFNFGLAGASTPLRSNRVTHFPRESSHDINNTTENSEANEDHHSSSFFSPISKLHNFHLESEIDNENDDAIAQQNQGPRYQDMSSPTPISESSLYPLLLHSDNTEHQTYNMKDGNEERHSDQNIVKTMKLLDNQEYVENNNNSDNNHEEDDDYDEDDDAHNAAANESFLNSSDIDEIPIREDISSIPPPIFINKRKRQLAESPPAADSTPIGTNMTITPDNNQLFRKLALESHKLPGEPPSDRRNNTLADLNISASSINSSVFKISFNDSTPCPTSPKRKKIRLLSGSATKLRVKGPILDFSNCRKSSLSEAQAIQNCINSNNESLSSNDDGERQILEKSPDQEYSASSSSMMYLPNSRQSSPTSTPISQSTPDNSAAPSHEKKKPKSQPGVKRSPKPPVQVVEYGEPINGYKYVTPVNNQRYFANPTTPLVYAAVQATGATTIENLYFNELLQLGDQRMVVDADSTNMHSRAYEANGTNDYSRIIEDDNNNNNGSKQYLLSEEMNPRRNDPYLIGNFKKTNKKGTQIREEYDQLFKLPLLQIFGMDANLTPLKEQLWAWINDSESLVNFYNYVKHPEETIFGLIKSDRRRWHPDKWPAAKLEKYELDADTVSLLSQALNSIIDDLV